MTELNDILVPISLFAMIWGVVWVSTYFANKKREDILKTIRHAVDKGQALDTKVIEGLTPKKDPFAELKVGVVLIGASVGMTALGAAIGTIAAEAFMPIVGSAAIPFFIGVSLVSLHMLLRNKDKSAR
jgi:hypothetical protein